MEIYYAHKNYVENEHIRQLLGKELRKYFKKNFKLALREEDFNHFLDLIVFIYIKNEYSNNLISDFCKKKSLKFIQLRNKLTQYFLYPYVKNETIDVMAELNTFLLKFTYDMHALVEKKEINNSNLYLKKDMERNVLYQIRNKLESLGVIYYDSSFTPLVKRIYELYSKYTNLTSTHLFIARELGSQDLEFFDLIFEIYFDLHEKKFYNMDLKKRDPLALNYVILKSLIVANVDYKDKNFYYLGSLFFKVLSNGTLKLSLKSYLGKNPNYNKAAIQFTDCSKEEKVDSLIDFMEKNILSQLS